MRIGLVSHCYLPHLGGIEIVVHNLARELARRHDVVIVSSASFGQSGVAREDSAEVHRLPSLHWTERAGVPYPVPLGPGVLRARRALASCDVVHAHGALYPTTLLAGSTGRPVVLTEHVGFIEYPRAAVNAVERMAWSAIGDNVVRRARVVTSVGERPAAWLRARFPRKDVRLVPNGVDLERFRPGDKSAARARFGLPLSDLLGLFVGRRTAKKNLDAVLAIPRAAFSLVVAGDPNGVREERVHDLGILKHDDMPALFQAVDFLVHAATGEGFPLVVQEALAAGLPVALLWDHGYDAILHRSAVRAVDSLAELSAAVTSLDANARAALSAGARAEAQRWSWAATAATYLSLYEEAARS